MAVKRGQLGGSCVWPEPVVCCLLQKRTNHPVIKAALAPPQTADAVELLRLGAFFSNAALVSQLCAWLASQLPGLDEEMVLEVSVCRLGAAVWLRCEHLCAALLLLAVPSCCLEHPLAGSST